MLAEFSGRKLRNACKKKDITQEALAEQAGASDRYVRDLESGRKSNPSAVLLCQMPKALDIPMDDLMELLAEDSSAE